MSSVEEAFSASGIPLGLVLLMSGFYAFGKYANKSVPDKWRKAAAAWIRGTIPIRDFASILSTWLDVYLGRNHFSVRCATRSLIMSLVVFVAFFCLWFGQQATEGFALASKISGGGVKSINWILGAILTVWIPDYLSILETRMLLRIAATKGLVGQLVILTADALATLAIYVTVSSVVMYFFYDMGDEGNFADIAQLWRYVFIEQGFFAFSATIYIFMYSAFASTIWIVSAFFASATIRSLASFQFLLSKFNEKRIEEEPFELFGEAAATLVGFVAAISYLLDTY